MSGPGKPVFSAAVVLTAQTASFSIVRNGAAPVAVSFTVSPDRYWLGESAASRNLVVDVIAALNAASGIGPFAYVVSGTSDNLGVAAALTYDDSGTPGALATLTIGSMNAVAADVFWALGFRNPTTITFTVVGEGATALTTGIPRYTWFPKAWAINVDDYRPVAQQAASSALAGSGALVSSVRQDDGDMRWWRSWRMTQVAAARSSYPKAVSTANPAWAAIAGLTTNPGDAALDNQGGWWQRTCAGEYTFAAIEDEAGLTATGTTIWDVYRVVDDPGVPTPMDGWKSLQPPNVETYSTAGALRTVSFAAVAYRVGNT
jgi:hypothetical protein